MKYDLLIQNMASKKEYLITGLEDRSDSYLCYVFNNFSMPEKAQEGEYEGLLFYNGRNDCEYTLNDVLEETLISTSDGDVLVKHLRPERFILKYGNITRSNAYRSENKEYAYYERK